MIASADHTGAMDVARAQITKVVRVPKFLSAEDIAELTAVADDAAQAVPFTCPMQASISRFSCRLLTQFNPILSRFFIYDYLLAFFPSHYIP
jgi:hypothetical protein